MKNPMFAFAPLSPERASTTSPMRAGAVEPKLESAIEELVSYDARFAKASNMGGGVVGMVVVPIAVPPLVGSRILIAVLSCDCGYMAG